MQCHGSETGDAAAGEGGPVILLGNPNVGKSVIFGHLTGRYVVVANYPGTTVEVTRGAANFNGRKRTVIDTPGVNSLTPLSEDERVARNILLTERPHCVVLIADTKNLARSFLLALQVAELELPFVICLNMIDEAEEQGVAVARQRLREFFGVDAVETVATRRQGIEELVESLERPTRARCAVRYDDAIERAAAEAENELPPETTGRRGLALMLLAGDETLADALGLSPGARARIATISQRLQSGYREPMGYVIGRQRLGTVRQIMGEVYSISARRRRPLSVLIGEWAIHPIAGIPILLAVLYAVYKFVGELGAGTLVDFLEGVVFKDYIDPAAEWLANVLLPAAVLRDFFVGEYGQVTMALSYGVAIILPVVGTFFLAFSLLEDSGYLARLAVMANRPFKLLGLNGRAVLPMILGLGCDTMATMTTRILETRRERIQATLLLALAVPCSAQLGVILGIMADLGTRAVAVWASVVLATMFVVGFLSARVLPGQRSDFIQELPPIRVPRLSNVLIKTVARIEWYLKEVLPLFILGTAILFVIDLVGLLGGIERAASPLVQGVLGLPRETTQAFLMGFLRRDYGAAGLFDLTRSGQLTLAQTVVSLVVITLFVPCIANFLMMVKEFGTRTALAVAAFIFPMAFLVGGLLHLVIRVGGISF
jgi:ferrous iron transport protein B